jgi:hypothetical protein
MSRKSPVTAVFLLTLSAVAGLPTSAAAQDRLGGHFGFVIPLVTHANDTTTTVSDDFVIGFPTGITVKTGGRVAFDLELVPVIQNAPLHVDLTVHPGVIVSVVDRLSLGLRMAFDVGRASWGFTPLVNRSFALTDTAAVFGELVVPIRFQSDAFGSDFTSIGVGIHVGVGF